jgi:hypothetical protein
MDGHSTTARYRNTDILRVPYMTIYLDTGGKQGIIMRSRMNQAARMLHLSLYLHSSKEGHWTVETPNGSYEYRDGMRLMRARGGQHEYVRYPDDPEPDP